MENNIKPITVVVPVYNGSKYLKKTMDSVLNSKFKDFTLLCIDDSSTDDSLEILNEYSSKDNRVQVLTKPNGGNAVKSLIFALSQIESEYMFYMSQDDIISDDLLENLYSKALETNADAIIPDMVVYYEKKNDNKVMHGRNGDTSVVLSNKEAFILSLDWQIHGFSLRKTSLMKKLDIVGNNSYYDEFLTREYYLNSNEIVFCDGQFFYRQDNENAITKKFRESSLDLLDIQIKLIDLIASQNIEKVILTNFISSTFRLIADFKKKVLHSDELRNECKKKLLKRLSNRYRFLIKKLCSMSNYQLAAKYCFRFFKYN